MMSQDGHMMVCYMMVHTMLHDGHMMLHDGHLMVHDGHMMLHDGYMMMMMMAT